VIPSNKGPFTGRGSLRNVEIERLDDRRVRACGDNEAVGHRQASADELAEVGSLTPSIDNVVPGEVTQRHDDLHAVSLTYRVGLAPSRRIALS
jgi:hypothetical protein